MAGIDISTSFKSIGEIPTDYFKANKRQSMPESSNKNKSSELCYDLGDVFTAMQEEGDYSMLNIALKFMNNLYPEDLYMFFDDLRVIERKLFNKNDINYVEVEDTYSKYRPILATDYISFVLLYHREATTKLFDKTEEYSLNQMKFLLSRNKTLLEVLPQIGTKISRKHYVDYVIDNDNPADN